MSKDYRGQTGIIGKWKGYDVFVLSQEEYMDMPMADPNTIYVIEDDRCKMVWRGVIVGNLIMSEGTVVEDRQGEYRPVRKKVEQEPQKEVGEYEQYATIVNEFFKNLKDPIIVE